MVLLAVGVLAGGCAGTGKRDGGTGFDEVEKRGKHLGAGLSSIMPHRASQADESTAEGDSTDDGGRKTPRGRPWSDDPPPGLEHAKGGPPDTPPGLAKGRERAAEGAPARDGAETGEWSGANETASGRSMDYQPEGRETGEYSPGPGYSMWGQDFSMGFAFLAKGGRFSRDISTTDDADGRADFDSGGSWGLEAALLIRQEFGPELALGLSYERLTTAARPELLSDGSLVMNPVMLNVEYSNAFPGFRRFRYLFGVGVGLSFVGHELSEKARAECAAAGYGCSEEVGAGFGADFHLGPRYRFTPWLEGQFTFGVAGFSHRADFKTVDLVLGTEREADANADFHWAYASAGLRVVF